MSRAALILIALSGCEFSIRSTGIVDAPIETLPIDAAIDAAIDARAPDPCRAAEVAANSAHTCARMETGDLWCWGKNAQGEVARGRQRVVPRLECVWPAWPGHLTGAIMDAPARATLCP